MMDWMVSKKFHIFDIERFMGILRDLKLTTPKSPRLRVIFQNKYNPVSKNMECCVQ